MSPESHETEIKLALESAEQGRRLLDTAGFSVSRSRYFESNVVLDTGDASLRASRRLLRLRREPARCLLTYKGAAEPSRHKVREELETSIDDPDSILAILERLGYRTAWRYEKFRTRYKSPGAGHVFLDETPCGAFLELEGPADWIDATAIALGFAESDYILVSYGSLYREFCSRLGRPAGDMTFDSEARPGASARCP